MKQQRHAGRLVDAAALRLDDAVLDLVGHAEPVAPADRVRLHHEVDTVGELAAVERDRPALVEARRVTVSGSIATAGSQWRTPMIGSTMSIDRVEVLELLRLVGRAPDVGVGRVRLLGARAVGQARARAATRSSPCARRARRRTARRATACRSAAPGWRAARSGRSARCRCPCRSSRRPRCRRRRSCIACTSIVPVTARPSGVVLKYVLPPLEMWNAPHWSATSPSWTSCSRQSTTRASSAPYSSARAGIPSTSSSSYWPRSAVYAYGMPPFSRIQATATEVSRPPEKAMPMRSPTGSEVRMRDTVGGG